MGHVVLAKSANQRFSLSWCKVGESLVRCQLSLDHLILASSARMIRKILPCDIFRMGWRSVQISKRCATGFTAYRWYAGSTRWKQTPSCRLRTSETYSACDQQSGIAAPVGQPGFILACGKSGPSQTCSVSMPPWFEKSSIAVMNGFGSRPAASS